MLIWTRPNQNIPEEEYQKVISDIHTTFLVIIRAIISRWPYKGYLQSVPLGK